ncbi:MAG: DUF2842 domain-containing protein [Proteobacteria bacterium]|nr:DUF2842 domain-containing protein [Pseudomonadota bacterium]
MNIRVRKLIGTFAMLLWLIVYALLAMGVGGNYVVGHGLLIELGYFIIAGFAWLPLSMLIIRWMSRPDPATPDDDTAADGGR